MRTGNKADLVQCLTSTQTQTAKAVLDTSSSPDGPPQTSSLLYINVAPTVSLEEGVVPAELLDDTTGFFAIEDIATRTMPFDIKDILEDNAAIALTHPEPARKSPRVLRAACST